MQYFWVRLASRRVSNRNIRAWCPLMLVMGSTRGIGVPGLVLASVLCFVAAMPAPAAVTSATARPFARSSVPIAALPVPLGSELLGGDSQHLLYQTPGSPSTEVETFAPGTHWFEVDLVSRKQVEVAPPGPGCGIEAAGPGGIVGRCPSPTGEPVSGVRLFESTIPFTSWTPFDLSPAATSNIQSFRVRTVGTQWLLLNIVGFRDSGSLYASRHDERVVARAGVQDINSATLTISPCRPLKTKGLNAYSKPWGLYGGSTLSAQRCGNKHRRVLARHVDPRVAPTLHAGRATWSAEGIGYVQDLRTTKTRTVRVPAANIRLWQQGNYVLAQQNGSAYTSGYVGIVRLR